MILQDFLVCGLIAIGEEDKRLEWLDAAAGELAKEYLKNKRKLIDAILVALDEELPESEPVFEAVEAVVLKHWKAMRGKYPDRPRQILRGVILAAIDKVRGDATAASVVWLVGGSYLPYARIKKERSIVEKLLAEFGEIAESVAIAAWATVRPPKEPKLPGWSLKLADVTVKKLAEDWLQERLGAAAGSGNECDGFPNNPHKIAGNQYQGGHQPQWATHFSAHAAKAISAGINAVMTPFAGELTAVLSHLEGPLKEHGTAVNAAVREAIRQGTESQLAQERRTALLWWRQTLYSPSRRRGYRGLRPGALAALMAFDLHKEMPSLAPQSVEFLLREAVREAAGTGVEVEGSQLLSEIIAANTTLGLTELLGPTGDGSSGRICLMAFVREVLAGPAGATEFEARIGIPLAQALLPEEWAVWLFRDLQALRLAA